MVDSVSDATGSSMERLTGAEVQEQGGVFRDSVTTWLTFAGFKTYVLLICFQTTTTTLHR